ncbi:MAG TPA: ABC transporter ATP-binding protein [Bacteroidia bacterium]|nr:ABC transporter ATP-binding protein [Bacteroidia bacterium]
MQLKQKFISELQSSLQHNDISLLTRRLMDLNEEFQLDDELATQIIQLRRTHLSSDTNENADKGTIKTEAAKLIDLFSRNEVSPKAVAKSEHQLIIDAQKISKKFTQGRNPFFLQPLDVTLSTGQITGVVGENGNGKTTLLRILAGELSTDSGSILFPALELQENDWYSVKNHTAFIPQRIPKWYGTLLDNLRFFASIHGIKGKENEKRIDYILFRLGLDKYRDLKWTEISSGYRLRFELAKMLLWKPKLLILDEPLSNLDINAQQLFLQDLRFFTFSEAHPMSILLSSQNLHEIEKVADNIIFIRQGKTIYNGPQKQFANERVQNSFEISGEFDLEKLSDCFKKYNDITVDNAGTSFIINTSTDKDLYFITKILAENNLTLNYIRNISQSTRKLFHKDI